MNSKILIYLAFLFIFTSCGVKGPPAQYPEIVIDSYVKNYTGTEPTAEELDRIKEKNVIPSPPDQQQKPVKKQ